MVALYRCVAMMGLGLMGSRDAHLRVKFLACLAAVNVVIVHSLYFKPWHVFDYSTDVAPTIHWRDSDMVGVPHASAEMVVRK